MTTRTGLTLKQYLGAASQYIVILDHGPLQCRTI